MSKILFKNFQNNEENKNEWKRKKRIETNDESTIYEKAEKIIE